MKVATSATLREEFANAVTHGIGLILACVGAVPLLLIATQRGEAWHIAACAIYVAALVGVYAASTLSHAYQRPRPKRFFRVWDQALIYLLIVGTYTPFAVQYLHFGWWRVLFGLMWSVALAGFISKVVFEHRIRCVSIGSYVLLGWMPAMAIKPMFELFPLDCTLWVLAGGICYSIGTIFLNLDTKIRYAHAVWHVLVIAGSICHYIAILFYTLPPV